MCQSEVSDIETGIWQTYQDQGVVVWGIASQDNFDTVVAYRDFYGLTYPILFDETGDVHALYDQANAFQGTLYPDDWIVGSDGRVVYVNNGYDHDAMAAILDAELAP